MNNPLDEMGFDPNELMVYTGFNWDMVAGIDQIVKEISKVESRFVTSNMKRVTQINGKLDRIGQRVMSPVSSRVSQIGQSLNQLDTKVSNDLITNVSNLQSFTSALPETDSNQILPITPVPDCGDLPVWNGTIVQGIPYQWTVINPKTLPLTLDKRMGWYVNNYGEIASLYLLNQVFIPPWDLVITGNAFDYPNPCPPDAPPQPPPPQPPTPQPPSPQPPPPSDDGIPGGKWWIVFRWISCVVTEPQFEQWENPPSNRVAYGPFDDAHILAVAFRSSELAPALEEAQYQYDPLVQQMLQGVYNQLIASGVDYSGIDIYGDPAYGLPLFTEVNFSTCEPQLPPEPPTPPPQPPGTPCPPCPPTGIPPDCPPSCPPIVDLTELVKVLKQIRDCVCKDKPIDDDDDDVQEDVDCRLENLLAYGLSACVVEDAKKAIEDIGVAYPTVYPSIAMTEVMASAIGFANNSYPRDQE